MADPDENSSSPQQASQDLNGQPPRTTYGAIIKVVGIGGGGSNAVNRMIRDSLPGVETIAINTDAQALLPSEADVSLVIGRETTKGLGAGSDPQVGKRAAEEQQELIEQALKGADMVFITAGEGGGTGTGAAPVVASVARQGGALTIGVVTRPFSFEGKRRDLQAEEGIEELRKEVDALIVIQNDRLLEMTDEKASVTMLEAFRLADEVLNDGVSGIAGLISNPGLINIDFADVRTILQDAGTALMGIGMAKGDNRAANAARSAIDSELMEGSIAGAQGVLLNIAAGEDLGMREVQTAAETVQEHCSSNCHIIFGSIIDKNLQDEIKVTVIAAGFNRFEREASPLSSFIEGDSFFPDAEETEMPVTESERDDDFEVPSFLR